MAGEIPPLNIKVNIDTSTVTVGVAKATAGLEQISSRAKTLTGNLSKFKEMAFGVFGGNLITTGVMAIGHELNAMKQETIDLQQQTIRLNQALSGVGITSEKIQKAVYDNADAYYQLGFQGSEAISAMGTLVTATGNVTQANKLMAMSADLARYKHIDMETAAKILARGTQGSAKAFKELGITLDTTIPKNKAIANAFDELNTKIGGQAQAYTKSFAGQMDILKERFDQVFQTVSAKVLPVLSTFLQYITNNGTALLIYGGIVLSIISVIKIYGATVAAIKSIQQAYAFWTYAQAASTNVFKFAMVGLNAAIKANPIGFLVAALMALGVAFVYAWNHFQGFRDAIVKGLQIIVNGFGYLIGAVAKAMGALSRVPGFGFLKGAAKAASEAANSVRKFSDNLDGLKDKKISTPNILGGIKPGDLTGIQGNVPGGGGAGSGSGSGSKTAAVPGSAEWFKEQAGTVTYIYNINTTAETNASPKLIADSTVSAIKFGKPKVMTVPKATVKTP